MFQLFMLVCPSLSQYPIMKLSLSGYIKYMLSVLMEIFDDIRPELFLLVGRG